MPSFEEARKIILDSVVPLGVEKVEILTATGRVLAEDIAAPWDMPLWDNTAMDGYAVHAVDCPGGGTLKLAGFLPAGDHMIAEVERGTAVKIMTGAPIPPGVDAVVPYEETEEQDDRVTIKTAVKPGDHIRFKGEDVRSGETVLPAGTLLRPSEISMLASFGKVFVPVYRRARVAILSTGDELVEPGEALAPGKIINSNSLALAAAVTQAGGIPVMLGIARDNRESLREKLVEGLRADVLITSAGVSAGDCDYVRDVLTELMVVQAFWRVDIKPGRPTAFGLRDGKPIFSLPGNPVSSLLTFEEFVRPALLKMMGHSRVLRPMVKATLQMDIPKKPGRVNFIRVAVTQENGEFLVQSAGKQDTGFLKTLLLADGIAVIPAEKQDLRAGDKVDVHLLD
ncbi:MAG: molybdopterin molybdenumtransferase MoeA [Deltaproteobacteria bacterium]|nr:molybdopterin molybdenumtransferase MoeA [Deltaproteobacteria bacterium]TLN01133.1 MAG: molybdopterin molybdotransferase MoeA [bacterium]